MNEHIHTLADHRGPRRVFVNGNEIHGALYADTRKGVVIFAPQPARVNRKRDELYTRTLRGEVRVEKID